MLITTLDGGTTWTARATGVTTALRAVAFADPQFGIAVGDGATILRSTDGGVTWAHASWPGLPPSTQLLAAAMSRTRSLAWVTGDGVIARSTDGGATFAAVAGVPANRWRGLRFAADAQ